MQSALAEFVISLNLGEKLLPKRNHEIIWFYLFFPVFIGYLWILSTYLNLKPSVGTVEIYDPSLSELIYPNYRMQVVATGLNWAEGPTWITDENAGIGYVIFSDTINNRIYKWEDGRGMFTVGKTIYQEKGGCSNDPRCDSLLEPGSNGLIRRDSTSLDLIVCQHGARSISLLRENGTWSKVATQFKGKKLNSPNDLAFSLDGHLYFTDAPYGLFKKNTSEDLEQEIPFSGVYLIPRDYLHNAMVLGVETASVTLLDKSMQRPNGIAFSPDFSKLYVSNSDPSLPVIKVFDVADNGALQNGRIFFDASELVEAERTRIRAEAIAGCEKDVTSSNVPIPPVQREPSSPCPSPRQVGMLDGMKVDIHGNLFIAGPGGVLVISQVRVCLNFTLLRNSHYSGGKALGTI